MSLPESARLPEKIVAAAPRRGWLRAWHLRLGRRGERLAAHLLRELGLEIVACNYRGPHGELDLVARDGAMLCFVEVKSGRRASQARPGRMLTAHKKWCVARTAEHYLRELGRPALAYRFDLVEIVMQGWRLREARYWPGEFAAADLLELPSGRIVDRRDRV